MHKEDPEQPTRKQQQASGVVQNQHPGASRLAAFVKDIDGIHIDAGHR